MVSNTERANSCLAAALDVFNFTEETHSGAAGLEVAVVAEVRTVEAHVRGDIAAEAALVIDKLFTVLGAGDVAEAELLRQALFASQVLCMGLPFFSHDDPAVVHSAKVGLFASMALVEGAGGKCESWEVLKVLVIGISKLWRFSQSGD